MTITDTQQGTGLGVHVVYPVIDIDIHEISAYFAAFASLWDACERLIRVHFLHSPTK